MRNRRFLQRYASWCYPAIGVQHLTFQAKRLQKNSAKDIASFENLNPQADSFCNYHNSSGWLLVRTKKLLVDKAQQLTLRLLEMMMLVDSMCVLNINYNSFFNDILMARPSQLINNFFINLLNINTV